MADGRFSRRHFLESVALAAAASAAGCTLPRPAGRLVPAVNIPESPTPGEAVLFRSVCRGCPAGCGLEARVRQGRAIKLEGNPDHPVNRGKLCALGQAQIELLYHPDRLPGPLAADTRGKLLPVAWDEADKRFTIGLKAAISAGKRIAVVGGPVTGLLRELVPQWLTALGQDPTGACFVESEVVQARRAAAKTVWGEDALPIHDLGAARALLAIGDDFLDEGPSPVEDARGLVQMRAAGGRFVYAGARISRTAAAAADVVLVAPGTELDLVLGLARTVLDAGWSPLDSDLATSLRVAVNAWTPAATAARTGLSQARIRDLARWLATSGPALVTGPGRASGAPAVAVATAVQLLNLVCGAAGTTLHFGGDAPAAAADTTAATDDPPATDDPAAAPPAKPWSLADLRKAVAAGDLGAVVVLEDGKRLDLDWKAIPFVAVLGRWENDITAHADLVLATHHPLEDWDRVEVRPGVLGIQQPVMTPLHDTRSPGDVLLKVAGALGATGLPRHDVGRQVRHGHSRAAIADGGEFAAKPPQHAPVPAPGMATHSWGDPGKKTAQGLALVAFPSLASPGDTLARASVLHEIPDPISTISWSGWVEISAHAARAHGIADGDLVRVSSAAGAVTLPAWIWSGLAPGAVGIPAAWAAPLQPGGSAGPVAVSLAATGRHARPPTEAGSDSQHDRGLAVTVPTAKTKVPRPENPQFYPKEEYPKHRWGLSVDLDKCTGCGACIVSCNAENNVPIVGAAEVAHGRSMAWMRIDRFIQGDDVRFLPVMCQQCGAAPCESVCPVFATYHNPEGLNAQIYNRCVGTRYCENNCPYTARAFNWFDHPRDKLEAMALNPDVTVRDRGVTEKCTFCVQRIRLAEEHAKLEHREVRRGEILPACVQTCPSGALTFGDLTDAGSDVAIAAKQPRAYRLLEELNTDPGVHYLARVRKEKVG